MRYVFFENWTHVWHMALMTVISFMALFILIRISGKRTLAKFNAFDFIVTVALGSVLAFMMLAKITFTEGLVVLLLIIGLQYLFARLSRASDTMDQVLNASPRLLFYKGQYLKDNMKKEAITEEEISAVIRQEGIAKFEDVLAVVIEPNASVSVIKKPGKPENRNLLDKLNIPDPD
ncbi:DUF421 domain-containing protein [uncultured Chryseobacterium sp.]|uniref:DUF421 domain-containing protein n=1 Tax=uncultured Chryseobacterium sp. TaxID=259322 RepID=UPI0025D195FC|nr:YetF domain-containing protein [uncultured Chryseobacterium sp.]